MLIPMWKLVQQFPLSITGILHVGAHECEELKDYQAVPIEKEEENRSRKQPVTNYYKGINGKWLLKKVKKINNKG